jgi:hypothetical protein
MSKIEVDAIDKQSGSTLTLGGSGTAVTLACGATQTGFGRSGSVNWDTTPKTATFTGVSGNGYFVNTTAGVVTANLPASPSAGDIMAVVDYAGTAATNNITVGRNGSNINGAASDKTISESNSGATFVYVDGTQGWKFTETANISDIAESPKYIAASGGTEVESGDFRIHTFTGPGTLCVSCAGNSLGSNKVSYLVIGGGASGATNRGGGGGAGGFREGKASGDSYTASPLNAPVGLPVSVQGYPITVGGGGPGAGSGATPTPSVPGNAGSNSIFSTITSAGGGGGGYDGAGINGGSGGGGGYPHAGGSGNTPPVSPPQGNNGGTGSGSPNSGAGGGGAGGVGGASSEDVAGAGAAGVTTSITGSPVTRAGGGGGSGNSSGGAAGPGGGGTGYVGPGGGQPIPASSGDVNSGGGGGAQRNTPSGGGGSGIVIIRYKFQ